MRFIEKIKEWIRMLKKEKVKLINESESTNNTKKKDYFVEQIDLMERQELLNLQSQLESGQVSVDDISIFETMDILELYGEHIPRID